MYTVVNVRAPKAPALEKDGKTIIGKRKSLFQTLPFQGTISGIRGKNDFWQTKMDLFQGVAFPSTNFGDTSKRIIFSKKKHLFKSWPLLTTSSGRTSTSRFFGSESHFPNQFSSPIIDFSSQKQVNQAICWAYM
jgi:hypothetical protein